MGKKFSEQGISNQTNHSTRSARVPLVFMVSSDSAQVDAVLSQCSDVPENYTVYPNISELMSALSQLTRLHLAFAVIVEKSADAVDAPLLRSCKLEYPQLNYVLMLEDCTQAHYLRFQSIGIQNVIIPPFDDVSLTSEIATALPNIPQFKRHPELTKRGMVRFDFLIPSDLAYALGINYLISLLLKEFSYPLADCRINIPLACDEAITNSILHGNRSDPKKKVSIHIYISSSRFKIKIKDQGGGFDVADVANPTKGQNLMRSSGRGIYLMHSIMDKVKYSDGGRTVELEKTNANTSPENHSGKKS
ncbi:MAG: ATP-binding protein [Candidatus Krumholzibacteria bacterium]|nr:ATP-binding protein [Candidatus Krumholzibacteria bacterium]